MAIREISFVLVFLTGHVFSQYETMIVRANARGVPYEKTRQEIVNNFLSNKPLLNYIPVYNTEYGQWSGENEKHQLTQPVKKSRASFQLVQAQPIQLQSIQTQPVQLQPVQAQQVQHHQPPAAPDVDFQQLGQVIGRLKTDMQMLSHQTKHAYEDKLKELEEVRKLNDDLKVALQNTDVLRQSLNDHEKQLTALTKNIQDRSEFPPVNESGLKEFLNMIESLETMVRNIGYKYGESQKSQTNF